MVRFLTILTIWSWASLHVQAQGHPLMNGPIRSEEATRFDVQMVRTAISIGPRAGSIPGMAFIHILSDTPDAGTVTLLGEGIRVSRVSMHGQVPVWDQRDGRLLIELPESTKSNESRYEWLIKVEFLIAKGLSIRTNTAGRMAVWNGTEPGSDIWYPTPVDPMDSYFTQLRVSVPKFWDVWVGDGEGLPRPERVADGFSKREVFSGAVSFLAYDARSAFPKGVDIPVLTSTFKGGDEFSESTAALDASIDSYFSGIGYQNGGRFSLGDSTYSIALADGISSPISIGGKILTSTGLLVTDDPWDDQFRQIRTLVSGRIASRFSSVPPTDSWLSEAIPTWLSLNVFRQLDGEDASGLIYERLRDAYLAETVTYRRPLVWDRWEHVSDMQDAHARGKGVWVLRMLSERIGENVLAEAIVRFLTISETEMTDTETFREILESVSLENLTQFFDVWVYSAGHPELALTYSFDTPTETLSVTIQQEQDGLLIPDAFEVDIAFQYSSLEGTNRSLVRLDRRTQTSTIQTNLSPRYVFPDAFATVLLDYSGPLKLDDLVSQLRDATGAVPKIRSLRYLTNANPNSTILLGLRLFLQQEKDPAVLMSACQMLGVMAPSSSALSLLIGFAEHPDERVRQAAIRAIASFGDAATSGEDVGAFSTALNAANTGTSGYVLSAAITSLVKIRPSLTWSLVQSALVTPSSGDLVARTALGLVETGITEDRNLFGAIRPFLSVEHGIHLRIAAFEAFARIDAGGQTVAKIVTEWLSANEYQLRRAALLAIASYDEIEIDRRSLETMLSVEASPDLIRLINELMK